MERYEVLDNSEFVITHYVLKMNGVKRNERNIDMP